MAGHSSVHCNKNGRHIDKKKLPLGGWLLTYIGVFNCRPSFSYKVYILLLTYACYTAYHMSRKPFSVVGNVLAPSCKAEYGPNTTTCSEDDHGPSLSLRNVNPYDYTEGWPPFNTTHCKSLIGAMNYSWLFTYAIFMLLSGLVADRVNLRYFLTVGMIGSGVTVGLLGVAYYAEIHHLAYFIIVQIAVGIFQSTGWPATVAVMGNWFGKKNRGLLMGIWNSHTSVGNILGTAIPSIWARKGKPWAWSFFVPALIIIFMAGVIYFFLINDPVDVGLPPPKHHLDSEKEIENKDSEPDDTFELIEKEDTQDEKGAAKSKTEDEVWTDSEAQEDRSLIKNDKTANKMGTASKAISLVGALKIPGVVEFSVSLFFSKLVVYTFLFWLPYYVAFHSIGGSCTGNQKADLLATLYDVGGIIGGIFTGGLSDVINARAISCVIMMYCAVPILFMYRYIGHVSLAATIVLIILSGMFTNGPYALITTAVANDLGTHKSLQENQRAKATVTAIIDGMGSLGAAFGPLVTGVVSDYFGWDSAFYVLMIACFLSSLMLSRLFYKEIRSHYFNVKKWLQKKIYHRHSFS